MLNRGFIVAILVFVSLALGCGSSRQNGLAISRVAFGSCTRQEKPMPIWRTIAAAKPDLMILLGDNIYGDTTDMSVLREKYDLLKSNEDFKTVHDSVPMLATWDDHDMGKNDAGVEYPMKEESKKELFRFIDEPTNSARRNHPGVYDSYIFGPNGRRVQIILLDTRWFRSPLKQVIDEKKVKYYVPSDDPNATVLGEAQWAWLEKQLQRPAEVRIIASSIQVLSDQHRFEKWGNFPRERQRLLDLIDQYESESVYILSGDRHTAEISKLDRTGKGPIFDVTASSLNQGGGTGEEPNQYRVSGDRYGKTNFGVIEIDWTHRPPTCLIEIRDESGVAVRKFPESIAQ